MVPPTDTGARAGIGCNGMLDGAVFDTLPQRRILATAAGTCESSPPWATLYSEREQGTFTREPRAAGDDSPHGEDPSKPCLSRRLTPELSRPGALR